MPGILRTCWVLGAEAEAAYNLGRAAHRVGLLNVAVAHYERVLQLADEAAAADAAQQLSGLDLQPDAAAAGMDVDGAPCLDEATGQQQHQPARGAAAGTSAPSTLQEELRVLERGLAREAAHNLVLIYRASGAEDLARAIMRRYLTF